MADIDADERRELLAVGRALPPEPGRFPLRPGNGEDIDDAVADINRIPEEQRPEVRAHVTRWAVHDDTTDHLPDSWHIEGHHDA